MQQEPIVKAIEKVLPAVVNIMMSKHLDFYQQPLNMGYHQPFPMPQNKNVKVGGGSGFIVEPHGIILTNRHVIEDPRAEYVVVLQDEEKVVPEILARDTIHDVAILKINKKNLPTVELGDSSKIKLGQTVIAIGNALTLFKNSVSRGVVSGLSREIQAQSEVTKNQTKLRGLIQTDAAINPGNSGGPLIDLQGKAIGINAAMVFGAENIGFALPINNAKKDLNDLRRHGRIIQPFLGVRYIPITPELQSQFGLPVSCGALVVSEPEIKQGSQQAVVPQSPADRAGLKEADIILEFANKKITPEVSVSDILDECEPGQEVELTILRRNKQKTLKTVLAER